MKNKYGGWKQQHKQGTRQHTLTQLTLVFSMCSSKYCSSFAPLFFSIFWAVVVFLGNFDFLFYFFDIFLYLGAQKK